MNRKKCLIPFKVALSVSVFIHFITGCFCYIVHKRSHTSLCERLIKVRSGHFLDWYYCTSQLISTTDPINEIVASRFNLNFISWKTVWNYLSSITIHLYTNHNRTRILLDTMNLHPILSYNVMKLPLHLALLLYKLSKGTATLRSDFVIF